MLRMASKVLRVGFGKMGYDIARRIEPRTLPLVSFAYTDLLELHRLTSHIPGMISLQTAEFLYTICVLQEVEGDVIEIGSWQGKSTAYLARAVRDSCNGRVFAIDHFRGNLGKEGLYSVGGGIDSLRCQFEANMRSLGLEGVVTTLPLSSAEAQARVARRKARLLFIDGDHTESGVARDIELFCPLVASRGIVIFDDFDVTFPGVIRAAEKWVSDVKPRSIVVRNNMLICSLR